MKTKRDPVYDTLAATYQSLEARLLNECLLAKGFDEHTRREVIADFLFRQGVVIDQYWFMEDGVKWYAGVYFSDRPHSEIEKATMILPDDQYGMNYHEYAHGAADWAIENENNPDALESGNE